MKNYLCYLATLIMASVTFGQDTTYFDKGAKDVASLDLAHTYKVVLKDGNDTNQVEVKEYYATGEIKSERNYYPYSDKKLNGKSKLWYKNGQIRSDINFENGKIQGELRTYWENGQLKRKDIYEKSKLIEGKVWNEDGTEAEYYNYEKMPEFPGGINGLFKYLGDNIQYPKKAERKNIHGTVLLNFIVDKEGKVVDIKIVESVSPKIDAEAVRVVRKMPDWKPGLQDGRKVKISYNLPIKFSLR